MKLRVAFDASRSSTRSREVLYMDDGLSGADSVSIWNPTIDVPRFHNQREMKDLIVPLFFEDEIEL